MIVFVPQGFAYPASPEWTRKSGRDPPHNDYSLRFDDCAELLYWLLHAV